VPPLLDAATGLLAIESTADRPDELARALEFVLDFVGPGFTVEHFESAGKPSALLYRGTSRPSFRVVLNGHLDVVPATAAQFRPRRDGARLYARGAQDMKISALALALVFRELAPRLPYPLGLQLVTDEERGGRDGTLHQLLDDVLTSFAIIGESSGLDVVTESKGIVAVTLEATGRTAHSAYQWLDIRYPHADATFASRPAAEIAGYLQSFCTPGVTAIVERLDAPHHVDPAHPDVLALASAARSQGLGGSFLRKHGAGDGRFYGARGIPAVAFGIGGGGQHGPEEYADMSTIEPYLAALHSFLQGVT
jgi:succinyl-diaminopimelate desuccinylase